MRDRYWHLMAQRIQRAWHRYQSHRAACARTIQQAYRDYKGLNVYVKMRDHGHTILQQKKERRKFSLISMRRYLGDYLDVAGKGGAYLRATAGLSPSDLVLFSSRGQLVTFRLLRGGKFTPRMLILSDKALVMIVTKWTNQGAEQELDRSIPMNNIAGITMSPYSDDFLLIGVDGDKDFLISCPFKTELATYISYQRKLSIQFTTEYVF
jgi:myosin-1